MTLPTDPALLPLRRGMVLRRFNQGGSDEVGVVLRPLSDDSVECAHGWVDHRPDVGLFTVSFEHLRRGVWRVASPEDVAKVRALFLAHAEDYGTTSAAWVVAENDPGAWMTPPVALPWGPADVGAGRREAVAQLDAAERAYLRNAHWTKRRDLWVDPIDGAAWPSSSAIAIQRGRDEALEASLVPPTPEHAAKVRAWVRQVVRRPGRKADRKVGR